MSNLENNRETWLHRLALKMTPRFKELGYTLAPFRVSIGFVSGGMRSKSVAEVWEKTHSADQHHEIFIRPDEDDPVNIARSLAHELIHIAVGLSEGHRGEFTKVALALGFDRPMTSTPAGPLFRAWVMPLLDEMGPLPHARLTWPEREPKAAKGGAKNGSEEKAGPSSSAPPKQTTRLRKAKCEDCGYTVRVTQKWLSLGPPHCPQHGAMVLPDDDDGQDE